MMYGSSRPSTCIGTFTACARTVEACRAVYSVWRCGPFAAGVAQTKRRRRGVARVACF